jgi:arylsulfatase
VDFGISAEGGGLPDFFAGKWHLGEDENTLPINHGYDEMKYCGLYHLNVFTYTDEEWFPDMDTKVRDMYLKVTQGMLSGKAGEKPKEEFKVNGQYVNTPEKGLVGIPFLDEYIEKATLDYLEQAAKSKKLFFVSVNFMKQHQPNMPHPDYRHKSMSKSKYADSIVEFDARIGQIMDKLRELGLDENTFVFYTTDNGAWQDVYPDSGYTPFRGTKGTVREGGSRVPAIAWMPGKIKAGSKSHDILGGLDLMTTFASVAGAKLPDKDREGKPMIFDSYDMSPVLFGTGKCERNEWFYFTENELSPGAVRVGHYKAAFNLRGDGGQSTGGLAVDTNLGWKGPVKYCAGIPQIFDLWQDPQERYDIFMTNFTESTWTMMVFNDEIKKLMNTYVKYPPRKMQSEAYTGPLTLSQYERFQHVRETLEKKGFDLPMQRNE